MIELTRLLIKEHSRRLKQHYGWIGYLSVGLVLLMFGWMGVHAASRRAEEFTLARLDGVLTSLWVSWVVAAVLTGRDLSWRIRLEQILVWPTKGFLRRYTVVFVLGFLSLPLLVFLIVAEVWAGSRAGFTPLVLLATLIGAGMFVASVRLTASLVRTALQGRGCLPGAVRWSAMLAAVLLSVLSGASLLIPEVRVLFPGHQFALLISGERIRFSLVCMGALIALLIPADCATQRALIYSGIRGPLMPRRRTLVGECLLTVHPAWPRPLFRIALLGWLRSRNALLLCLWGLSYSFFYTYLSRPDEAFYFFLFIWMNLLFHSYLRGNLLGIDRGAAWLYYVLPVRIGSALSAKNLSLSLLQSCMVASLLAAGGLKADPQISRAAWSGVFIYSVSSLLFGEICGAFFSVRYPDPIDRLAQFSGGTTFGALVLPALNAIFLAAFLLGSGLANRFLSPVLHWCLLLTIPACLLAVRAAAVPAWADRALLNGRETILKKLSGISL